MDIRILPRHPLFHLPGWQNGVPSTQIKSIAAERAGLNEKIPLTLQFFYLILTFAESSILVCFFFFSPVLLKYYFSSTKHDLCFFHKHSFPESFILSAVLKRIKFYVELYVFFPSPRGIFFFFRKLILTRHLKGTILNVIIFSPVGFANTKQLIPF